MGDGLAVVLKEFVKGKVDGHIIPYLSGAPLQSQDGKPAHPLYENIRRAFRMDYGLYYVSGQIARIYESQYQSTAIHERQHVEDDVHATQSGIADLVDRRVAQEQLAYLRSIADEDEYQQPNAPYADLVEIIELAVNRQMNPLSWLSDMANIYGRQAVGNLRLLAARLGVDVSARRFDQTDILDVANDVLAAALALPGEGVALKDLVKAVHQEELDRQRHLGPRPVQNAQPAQPEPEQTSVTEEDNQLEAPQESAGRTERIAGNTLMVVTRFLEYWERLRARRGRILAVSAAAVTLGIGGYYLEQKFQPESLPVPVPKTAPAPSIAGDKGPIKWLTGLQFNFPLAPKPQEVLPGREIAPGERVWFPLSKDGTPIYLLNKRLTAEGLDEVFPGKGAGIVSALRREAGTWFSGGRLRADPSAEGMRPIVQRTADAVGVDGEQLQTVLSDYWKDTRPATEEEIGKVDHAEAPGGVDFNPRGLDISETGAADLFNVPVDVDTLRQVESPGFEGLTPFIRSIVPVDDIRLLLGLKPSV